MGSSKRSGYTLLELVVVMAILVLITAAFVLSFEHAHGYFKINGGADGVRGAWAQARARAIEDGRPYRFAVVPGTNRFRVAPDDPIYWTGSGTTTANGPDSALILNGTIPKGLRLGVNAESQPPSANVPAPPAAEDDDRSGDLGAFKSAAVFLADGTAREDYDLTLKDDSGRAGSITIRLRALTGTWKTVTGKENR